MVITGLKCISGIVFQLILVTMDVIEKYKWFVGIFPYTFLHFSIHWDILVVMVILPDWFFLNSIYVCVCVDDSLYLCEVRSSDDGREGGRWHWLGHTLVDSDSVSVLCCCWFPSLLLPSSLFYFFLLSTHTHTYIHTYIYPKHIDCQTGVGWRSPSLFWWWFVSDS